MFYRCSITCCFATFLAVVTSLQRSQVVAENEDDNPTSQPLRHLAAFLEGETDDNNTIIPTLNETTASEMITEKDNNATAPHGLKMSIPLPLCEPYTAENGSVVGIEVINLTTAMHLISSHRHGLPAIPVTTLPELENSTVSQLSEEAEAEGDAENSTAANLSTPVLSSALPSPITPPRGRCIAIYLFARWCSFSAAAAPYISTLAKLFSSCCMKFVAVDAANDVSGTTTFFGAGSVPQLIIYRPHRPVVRISPITTDLALLIELVNNATGFNVTVANITALPEEDDFNNNVLPVVPVREFDLYLLAAWGHTVLTLLIIAYKFDYVRNLIFGIWNYLRGFGNEIHAHLE